MKNNHGIRGGLLFEPLPFSDIEQLPLPAQVTVSVAANATVAVATGEHVLTGQPLIHPSDNHVMSHASLSGTVTATTARSVTIKSDNRDKPYIHNNKPADYKSLFQSMGLVGLGGAAYPAFKKLLQSKTGTGVNTLLINAAECDPAIYCDEALMQERAADVVKGIQVARKATGAANCIVGIEKNKTAAIEQLQQHLPANITLAVVPAVYPVGAEQTLFKQCTGMDGSLQHNNALCFNVATCYSMYRAVELSQPLISRIVTLVHRDRAANFELRIGTPLSYLETATGTAMNSRLIEGGRMTGRSISKDRFIEKHTNSLILQPEKSTPAKPCIRCGACAEVCPENLYPQQLYWHTQPHNTVALTGLKLEQCIECACCDAVCPSHIPLTGLFNKALHTIKAEKDEQVKAALAKLRYEKRQSRLNDQSVRERKKLDDKTADLANANQTTDAKKALIAKALQRSKNKKSMEAGVRSKDPDH